MNITAAHAALAPALARAGAIVPEKSTIPVETCVLLETSDEGLFVTATNLDAIYRERVDTTPRDPWRGCVDAARLEAFVAGARGDGDVVLRADDEGRLSVRCGRASCRLPTLPAGDFALFSRPLDGAVELTLDAATFARALRTVAPAMSTEETRYYLNGAYLHSGRLCATDGHRLTLHTIAADTPLAPEIIVPRATVTQLVTLLRGIDGPLPVIVSERQIIISTQGWTLTSKLIDGTFPDYTRVVPKRSPSPLVVNREALRSAVALVAGVQDDKTRGLRLAIAGTDLVVESEGNDTLGSCEVSIPIEGEPPGGSWPVGLKPAYLLSALGVIDADLVELHVTSPSYPIWLCASGEAHDGSVLMPMRI